MNNNTGTGNDDDSQGGDAGTNGAAIRESSGISFTFGTTGGTINHHHLQMLQTHNKELHKRDR